MVIGFAAASCAQEFNSYIHPTNTRYDIFGGCQQRYVRLLRAPVVFCRSAVVKVAVSESSETLL